jgi:DNA-binding MarR family transcriptional regulator
MAIPFLTKFVSFDIRKDRVMARSRQTVVSALGDALQRYQRSVQAFDDAAARHLGIGPADLRCLDWLVDGPKTAGQLSEATGLRPAATTAMIDRLTTKGFVERIASDTDRRQVLVQMTQAGQKQTWAIYGPLADEGPRLLARFTVAELERMLDQFEEMRAITDRHRERLRGSDL